MRNKNTKRTFFSFLPYECAAAEEYLELMVEKGWLLESVKGNFFKFRKTDQKNIKYSVDVLHKISFFDSKDSESTLEYREYCKAAGWNYICQIGKIQIFNTQNDGRTIPIHTDEEEKFKSVLKTSLYNSSGQLFLTIMFMFNLFTQLFVLDSGFALASNLAIFSIIITVLIIIMSCIEFVNFVIWFIKAKWQLKRDEPMHYNNYKQIRIKNALGRIYASIVLIILLKFLTMGNIYHRGFNIYFLLILCIPVIIMICAKKIINRKNYSKVINMGITIGSIVVSTYIILTIGVGSVLLDSPKTTGNEALTEKVHLSFTDFGFKENNDFSSYNKFDKSIIAQRIDYDSSDKDNRLMYTVVESDSTLAIKIYEKTLMVKLSSYGVNLKRVDTDLPSSIVVYVDSNKREFVLVKQDRVVNIKSYFSDISDDEFLDVVYKKLLY